MSAERVKDKKGENINEGDHVYTRYRGGSHEGEVEKIVRGQAEADEENVANPPKVRNNAIPPRLPLIHRLRKSTTPMLTLEGHLYRSTWSSGCA
jgi:hypothetical protein